jgi:hypothetical protein
MQVSGKLVIIGIMALALTAAGTSWWFRYAATHKAADHWGPTALRLIRGAPLVKFYRLDRSSESAPALSDAGSFLNRQHSVDISKMPGLTHLRNALLEDRSYHWPARKTTPATRAWQWGLSFMDEASGEFVVLVFSADWKVVCVVPCKQRLSSEPIAEGLATMFSEFTAEEPTAR